ncbi:hypothetical protein [Porcipelethomonas sp.]|uniref:hypothetical protein n=1 Tax=Porcipelethomonas sp. TaxID=2981675 RepID=UPI003EF2DCCF
MDSILIIVFSFSAMLMVMIVASALKITASERIPEKGFITVVVLDGIEDTEKCINRIINKIMWTDEELIGSVILVDGGLNNEQAEICRSYCRRYDYLFFTSFEELGNIILEQRKMALK